MYYLHEYADILLEHMWKNPVSLPAKDFPMKTVVLTCLKKASNRTL